MVAPKAESIFTMRGEAVGIVLYCPECEPTTGIRWTRPLRVETMADYEFKPFPTPNLVTNPGPLGFIARCDVCGFRVEMHGDRLPTVEMMDSAVTKDAVHARRAALGQRDLIPGDKDGDR